MSLLKAQLIHFFLNENSFLTLKKYLFHFNLKIYYIDFKTLNCFLFVT